MIYGIKTSVTQGLWVAISAGSPRSGGMPDESFRTGLQNH